MLLTMLVRVGGDTGKTEVSHGVDLIALSLRDKRVSSVGPVVHCVAGRSRVSARRRTGVCLALYDTRV